MFQGFGLGGFAEQALIHENQLAVVPKEMPFAQAALLGCGIVTGAGSILNTANVSAGDTVVIFGVGGVGLNAVSGARIAGASRVVAIDIQQKRLDAARRFGATDVIDSTKSKPVESVRDLLPGGADHVFDFVGLKLVAEQGLAMLGTGGGLYLVGVAKPEVDISLNIFDAIGGQKRVLGVNFGSTNAKRDIPMYAELYLQGRMNLDDLVSKEIKLSEIEAGYEALKDGSTARAKNPPTYLDAAGATHPVPNLIQDHVDALLASLHIATPEDLVAFLRSLAATAGLDVLHVAFRAPATGRITHA